MPRVTVADGGGREFTALGAYIFAGGFTCGVKQAGFDVLAHFERGEYGTASAAANFPGLRIYKDPATWPVDEYAGAVDWVFSNPPCSAWSAAGSSVRDKWRTDPRVNCVRDSFSLLAGLRPRVWCWESVARAYTSGRPLVDELTAAALDLGYSVTHLLVEASSLGVPQRRNRFFMVAHDVRLEFPDPGRRRTTVAEALRGVTPGEGTGLPSAKWVDLLPELPPGGDLRELFMSKFPDEPVVNGRMVGRPSYQVRRLSADGVSFTITGGVRHLHPTEDRYLTVNEVAALCGYPRDFKFVGGLGKRYAQVAQAVMPPVARWLGDVVRRGVAAGVMTSGEVRLVDLRRPPYVRVDVVVDEADGRGEADDPGGGAAADRRGPTGRQAKIGCGATVRSSVGDDELPEMVDEDGGQSGRFIRRLLAEGRLSDEDIVRAVHKNLAGRRTTVRDVGWNRARLRRLQDEGGERCRE